MEGIDVNWCLVCDSHYSTTDSAPFCSSDCLLKHNRDTSFFTPRTPVPPSPQPIPINHHHAHTASSSFRSESFSELDLSASYRPSPTYPYASSSSYSYTHGKPSDWIGKGVDGISAWAASIPLGSSPQASSSRVQQHHTRNHSRQGSASSTPIDACSDSSSITPPSRPRTRASTMSSHTTPLRCLSLSTSQNKPAPPKVSYINSLSAQSHSNNASVECLPAGSTSPPTPTIHSKSVLTITPHTSLPSLTAQSSASASLTSIATPGSLLHGSRPSSRPVSPPLSEHGEDVNVPDDCHSEEPCPQPQQQQQQQRPFPATLRESKRQKKSTALFSHLAAHLRSWASSNSMTNNPPYSIAHQISVPRRHPLTASTSGSEQRSKTVTPPPVALSHEIQRQDMHRAPRSRQQQQDTIRAHESAPYLNDEELAFGFHEKESQDKVVRVGRGLVSVKKASAGKEREAAAFRDRGRKIERVWS